MAPLRHALLLLTAVVVIVTAGMLSVAEPAFAACGGEQALFWKGEAFTYGVREDIGFTNRTVDSGCANGETPYGSTAHVVLGSVYGNWVEMGWEAVKVSGGVSIDFFHEGGINFTTRYNNNQRSAAACPGGRFTATR